MADQYHPSDEIHFDEPHEPFSEEFQDHFFKAVAHHAGHGAHPGKYAEPKRPEPPTEAGLASERFLEQGPALPLPPAGALPPQEAVQQPPMQKGKQPSAKKPTGTTPAALGAEAVKPPAPEGEF